MCANTLSMGGTIRSWLHSHVNSKAPALSSDSRRRNPATGNRVRGDDDIGTSVPNGKIEAASGPDRPVHPRLAVQRTVRCNPPRQRRTRDETSRGAGRAAAPMAVSRGSKAARAARYMTIAWRRTGSDSAGASGGRRAGHRTLRLSPSTTTTEATMWRAPSRSSCCSGSSATWHTRHRERASARHNRNRAALRPLPAYVGQML